MHRPLMHQVPIRPSANSARSWSPSQARVRKPAPTASNAWLIMPSSAYSQRQVVPTATNGSTWGRKNTVR